MNIVIDIAYYVFVGIFLISLFISLKFSWGSEGKDERGQQINNIAYTTALPLFPIGWLFTELYHDFIQPLDYETYRWVIWTMVCGVYIVHAATIMVLKRKM